MNIVILTINSMSKTFRMPAMVHTMGFWASCFSCLSGVVRQLPDEVGTFGTVNTQNDSD